MRLHINGKTIKGEDITWDDLCCVGSYVTDEDPESMPKELICQKAEKARRIIIDCLRIFPDRFDEMKISGFIG